MSWNLLGAFFLQVAGIAPTGDPGSGFEIEGDLLANTPTANTTDWVPGVAGTGVGVLTAAGVPVDATKTFHLVDLFDSKSDDTFAGGVKLNENPNTSWTWVTSTALKKDDLNHGLLHISTDSNNHLWFVVAGDRLSNNGNSFVDIEFLQNTLTANADGTFTSAGPSGGRTVGDLDITLELTNGGTVPNFSIQRWQSVGPGFDYVTLTPAAGTAFAAANIAGTTPVPFGAFGSTTYDTNTFAEVAIDITALISGLDACIGIKTVIFKTKVSQSSNSVLADFITPIQLNLGTAPTAAAGPDLTACQANPGPTVFNPVGSGTNGTPAWSVVGMSGTASAAIINGSTFTPTVNVTGTGTITLRLTVSNEDCPAATDEVVLTVTAGATAMAGADQSLCQIAAEPTVFTLNGMVTAGSATPLWSVVGTTGTASPTIVSPNSTTTDVSIMGTGTATIRLTSATQNCGTGIDEVVLTVNPSPTAIAGNDETKCQDPSLTTAFTLNGAANNGSPTWSVTGTTGTAAGVIANPNSLTSGVNVTGIGTVTLQLLVESSLGCASATDEVVLTVNPPATVSAGPAQTVSACTTGVQLAGSFGGGASSVSWTTSGTGTFSPNAGTPTATYVPSLADVVSGSVMLTLTTNDPDGPCPLASSQVVITFTPCTDLAITKTDGSATYTAGNPISYKIVVSNAGPSDATGASVADTVPAVISGVMVGCVPTGSASCGTDGSAGNNVSFTGVNIAAGGGNFLTITVSGTVSAAATGNLVNTATVTAGAGQTDPNTQNNSATDTDTTDPRADLAVTKTDGVGTYTPGSSITYTIVVTNNGPSAVTGALVTDNKPAQVTTWTWACAGATGGATGCDGAASGSANFSDTVNLPVGSTITYTVMAQTSPSLTGDLVNTVNVAAPSGTTDPTPGNNSATDTDTANPVADLALVKTVDDALPVLAENVTFLISLTNNGPNTATNVQVGDPIPAGLTFVSSLASQGSYNSITGIWAVGTVNVGQTLTLQITVTVSTIGRFFNTAQVIASDQPDPNSTPGNNVPTENDQGSVEISSVPTVPEVSDQRPGSVLLYPVYVSSSSAPAQQNTRFSITNTNQNRGVYVHLFLVEGATCSVADLIVCLTQNQTFTTTALDLDPGVTGYMVAVAIDQNGCPISFNYLIGDESVKLQSGHFGSIGAEQIPAANGIVATCTPDSSTALLEFDGAHYARIPRVLALDNIPSRADGNNTMIFIDRFGGDLRGNASRIGSVFGLLYNDQEEAHSWQLNSNQCQFQAVLTNTFPRTAPPFDSVIPAGTSGWMKFWAGESSGLFGTYFNYNPQSAISAGAFGGAGNFHKLTLNNRVTITIPVFPPGC